MQKALYNLLDITKQSLIRAVNALVDGDFLSSLSLVNAIGAVSATPLLRKAVRWKRAAMQLLKSE